MTFACNIPGGESEPPSVNISCPDYCRLEYINNYKIENEQFKIIKITLKLCLYYECDGNVWSLKAEVCLCIDKKKQLKTKLHNFQIEKNNVV